MDPFDRHKPIAGPISRPIRSPALVPGQSDAERETGLVIGLVNNMPDSALKATERQFMRLVQSAAGKTLSCAISANPYSWRLSFLPTRSRSAIWVQAAAFPEFRWLSHGRIAQSF